MPAKAPRQTTRRDAVEPLRSCPAQHRCLPSRIYVSGATSFCASTHTLASVTEQPLSTCFQRFGSAPHLHRDGQRTASRRTSKTRNGAFAGRTAFGITSLV